MEKIAIISDIHGNITAFNAALKDIEKRGIKRIFCLGDLTIKCSAPKECVEEAFKKCEVIIKGNCESRSTEDCRTKEHLWNKSKLSEEMIQRIIRLPYSYDFYMSGLKIRLMHASNKTIHEKAYYWDFDEKFNERARKQFENTEFLGNIGQEEPNVVIFGHIHRPMICRIDDKMLINPGAISNTSDIVKINGKDYTYGSYLIIEGEFDSKEMDTITYQLIKFTYDNIKEANNILNTDMPNKEVSAKEIETGIYFDRKSLYEEHKNEVEME